MSLQAQIGSRVGGVHERRADRALTTLRGWPRPGDASCGSHWCEWHQAATAGIPQRQEAEVLLCTGVPAHMIR